MIVPAYFIFATVSAIVVGRTATVMKERMEAKQA